MVEKKEDNYYKNRDLSKKTEENRESAGVEQRKRERERERERESERERERERKSQRQKISD